MRTLAILALAATFSAKTVHAEPVPQPQRFDILPTALAQALQRFGEQSGFSIAYDAACLKGYVSGYVAGDIGPFEALDRILLGTPFTYQQTGKDTLRIIAKAPIQTPPRNAKIDDENPAAKTKDLPIETLLVTASKRPADAQAIPFSISAVSADRLADWGVTDFSGLAPRLAGIAFTNLGPSRNKIFLRGISDGSIADRTQSTVGVYLDETPIIFNDTNPDIRLIDIDRVEIVRGPQTTLFGAGSLGGVYRIITAKPDLKTHFAKANVAAGATTGGGPNSAVSGAANLTLVPEKLGMRFVSFFEFAGGYIDNAGLGTRNVNQSTIFGGRLALRYQPSKTWTADFAASVQKVDLDDTQYVFGEAPGLSRNTAVAEPYEDTFRHASFTLKGTWSWGEFVSSTAYIDRDLSSTFDATAALPALLGAEQSSGVGRYDTTNGIRAVTQEMRLVSLGERRFDWLIGGFASFRDEDLRSVLTVQDAGASTAAFASTREDTFQDYALFAEGTIRLIGALKLTAGLRWSLRELNVDVASSGLDTLSPDFFDNGRSERNVSPKAGLSYRLSDDLLIFMQATRGARIGGLNVNTPLAAVTLLDPEDDVTRFESDVLWHTELGLKSSWFDDRLIANLTAFRILWSEIQTDQILPTGFSFIANAGDARTTGLEAEVIARPFDTLELSANVFWNEARLTDPNPFLGAEAGDRLPNIPTVSMNAGALWSFRLLDEWSGTLSANYAYVGQSILTFSESTAPTMGRYHQADMQIAFSRGRYRLGLSITNIANEGGNTFAFGNPFSLATQSQATPLRPRSLQASLAWRF